MIALYAKRVRYTRHNIFSGGIHAMLNDKKKQEKTAEKSKQTVLSDDALENVTGGAGAFADVPRTDTHEYDDEVKEKV